MDSLVSGVFEIVNRIATICARGGSKGLPGKNLKELLGKPLIAYSIEQARESRLFSAIVVSSDSPAILSEAGRWGADHLVERPAEMAGDAASKLPPIAHAVRTVEDKRTGTFDVIVDLDVTSPLRTVDDIRGSVELYETRGVTNVITGAPARKVPYFNLVELTPDGYVALSKKTEPRIERRQDCPPCFDMNAAVYVWNRDVFMTNPDVFYPDTLLYEMPESRSHDIDTPLDFDFVELIMTKYADSI